VHSIPRNECTVTELPFMWPIYKIAISRQLQLQMAAIVTYIQPP
jgi:hypothetical protein